VLQIQDVYTGLAQMGAVSASGRCQRLATARATIVPSVRTASPTIAFVICVQITVLPGQLGGNAMVDGSFVPTGFGPGLAPAENYDHIEYER
jgi:hypothetical protein